MDQHAWLDRGIPTPERVIKGSLCAMMVECERFICLFTYLLKSQKLILSLV